jgi:hypothetical protein
MKVNFLKVTLLSVLLLISCFTHARLINSDYSITGDNGTVMDINTDLEWLDLQLTDGMSKLEASTKYSEFSFATSAQYFELMENEFRDFSKFSLGASDLLGNSRLDNFILQGWVGLFGATKGSNISRGFVENELDGTLLLGGVEVKRVYPNRAVGNVGQLRAEGLDSAGWFMVRAADIWTVPSPSTIAIMMIGVVGVIRRKFKK